MKSKINLKIFSVKLRNALLASKYVKYPNQLTLVGLLKKNSDRLMLLIKQMKLKALDCLFEATSAFCV